MRAWCGSRRKSSERESAKIHSPSFLPLLLACNNSLQTGTFCRPAWRIGCGEDVHLLVHARSGGYAPLVWEFSNFLFLPHLSLLFPTLFFAQFLRLPSQGRVSGGNQTCGKMVEGAFMGSGSGTWAYKILMANQTYRILLIACPDTLLTPLGCISRRPSPKQEVTRFSSHRLPRKRMVYHGYSGSLETEPHLPATNSFPGYFRRSCDDGGSLGFGSSTLVRIGLRYRLAGSVCD